MTGGKLVAVVVGAFLVLGACGGSTSSDGGSDGGGSGGSGGNGGGGTGGGATGGGGTGGCAGNPQMDCVDTCTGGFQGPICENGSWTCPPPVPCPAGGGGTAGCAGGGGIDCIDQCTGDFYLPDCVNGSWECADSSPCPDAGTCPTGQVPTIEGCLSCDAATTAFSNAIEAARLANAACNTAADCVLTGSGTACAGACQVAVSAAGQSAFAAALAKIDAGYCSGFVAVCGYSTPKCAMPTLECQAGLCQTVYQ